MKEALLKKRYGIPVALLLILLLSGTALAWYCFAIISSNSTVQEPLTVTEMKEFSANMYPGETNLWSFDINNSASVAYTVKADLTYISHGVSITSFLVLGADGALISDETDDLLDDGSAEFSILGKGILEKRTLLCNITISTAKDMAPGDVSVTLALSRG